MKEFKIASDVVEQFGNMIALRKTDKQRFPGIAELFVASVIQCQPMAEVEFLASGNLAAGSDKFRLHPCFSYQDL